MFCPNYKNKSVFRGFNNLIKAFGGKPLSEEEFRSVDLRNQRTGRDYSAMEAAYKVYNRNKGFTMEYTPSGEQSQLFRQLLEYYNGDTRAAIIAKSNVYSNRYTKEHGAWYDEINPVEPDVHDVINNKDFDAAMVLKRKAYPVFVTSTLELFDFNVVQALERGEAVSSKSIIDSLIRQGQLGQNHVVLSQILSKHDVQVVINRNLGNYDLMSTYTDKNGRSVIVINPSVMDKVTFSYFNEAFLHEMIHAVTVDIINNPVTAEDFAFVKKNHEMWSKLRGLYKEDDPALLDVESGLYALQNEKEFAAVFATDATAREFFFKLAERADANKNRGFLQKMKNFIISFIKAFSKKASFEYNTTEQLKEYQKNLTSYLFNQQKVQSKFSAEEIQQIQNNVGSWAYENQALLENVKSINKKLDLLERNNFLKITWRKKQASKTYSFEHIIQDLLVRRDALKSQLQDDVLRQKLLSEVDSQIESFQNQSVGKYVAMDQLLKQVVPRLMEDARKINNIVVNEDQSLSASEYMYQMHSNIGVYLEIAEQLSGVLKETSNKNDILREFNDGKTDEEKLTLDDLEKMQKIIEHVEGLCNDTKVALNIINGRIAQKSLLEQSEKSRATEEMRDFLALSQRTKGEGALINSITQTDVSWLEQNLFSQDSSTNAAVRALYSIVNEAVQRSNKKLAEKRQLLVELQDQLGANESVTDIYEKDNGITTGYIVRKLNFGKYYNKLDEKYVTLNKQFNDMFGKLDGYAVLPEKNRIAPSNETIITEKQREELGLPKVEDYQYTIRTAYNECINQFKAANGHRRYKAEYYSAWAQVPKLAKDELDAINLQINNLLHPVTEIKKGDKKKGEKDKKLVHLEQLSDPDYEKLLELQVRKKFLYSDYNEYGNKKSGIALEHARALQRLRNTLYGNKEANNDDEVDDSGKKKPVKREISKRWIEERNEIIKQCSTINNVYDPRAFGKYQNLEQWRKEIKAKCNLTKGTDHEISDEAAFSKYVRAKKEGKTYDGFDAAKYEEWKADINSIAKFDEKTYNRWMFRNSKRVFKLDENGKSPLWEKLEKAMRGFKVDYGEEYNKIDAEIKEMLAPLRDQSGRVIVQVMKDSFVEKLKELERKKTELKEKFKKNQDKDFKDLVTRWSDLISTYMRFEETEYYKQVYNKARATATMEDDSVDEDLFVILMKNYGYETEPDYTDMMMGIYDPQISPYSWSTKMVAKDDEFMDWVPGNQFSEEKGNEKYIDPDFDESYNTSFVPDAKLYNNEEAFNKIDKSKTLKALYDATLATMKEANALQTNRIYHDDYLLPQQTGSIWKRIKKHPWFHRSISVYNSITGDYDKKKISTKFGVMGRAILEKLGFLYNPDDAVEYGSSAALDTQTDETTLETVQKPIGVYPDGRPFHILPQYYTRRLQDASQISSDLVGILCDYYKMSTEYYEKMAIRDKCESIVDFMDNRGKYKDTTETATTKRYRAFEAASKFLEMNLYNVRRNAYVSNWGPLKINWTKFASVWKNTATALNLGASPKVALVGFISTISEFGLQALTKQYYNPADAWFGIQEMALNLLKTGGGINNIANKNSKDPLIVKMSYFNVAGMGDKMSKHTNRNRLVNAIVDNSIFGFLSTVDFLAKGTMMASITHGYRFVDGEFITKDEIQSKYYYLPKEERAKKIDKHSTAISLYDVMKVRTEIGEKDGLEHTIIDIDKQYKDAFNDVIEKVRSVVEKLTEQADGMQTELQKSAIMQGIMGSMIMIHRQYLPVVLQKGFTSQVYDYDMQQYKNGEIRVMYNYLSEVFANNMLLGSPMAAALGLAFGGWLGALTSVAIFSAIGGYKRYTNAKNGIGKKSMRQINDEFFNDFGSEMRAKRSQANKAAIKATLWRIGLYYMVVSQLANLACLLADGDDDSWWKQFMALCMRQFQWEFFSMYRTTDLFNTFRTPSAATSVLDQVESGSDAIEKGASYIVSRMFTREDMLYDASSAFGSIADIGSDDEIERGTYKGWEKWQRTVVKMTPYHNIIEQYLNSKAKRQFLENKTFKMQPEDNILEYKPFTGEPW